MAAGSPRRTVLSSAPQGAPGMLCGLLLLSSADVLVLWCTAHLLHAWHRAFSTLVLSLPPPRSSLLGAVGSVLGDVRTFVIALGPTARGAVALLPTLHYPSPGFVLRRTVQVGLSLPLAAAHDARGHGTLHLPRLAMLPACLPRCLHPALGSIQPCPFISSPPCAGAARCGRLPSLRILRGSRVQPHPPLHRLGGRAPRLAEGRGQLSGCSAEPAVAATRGQRPGDGGLRPQRVAGGGRCGGGGSASGVGSIGGSGQPRLAAHGGAGPSGNSAAAAGRRSLILSHILNRLRPTRSAVSSRGPGSADALVHIV